LRTALSRPNDDAGSPVTLAVVDVTTWSQPLNAPGAEVECNEVECNM
jgi:hypothetical protein